MLADQDATRAKLLFAKADNTQSLGRQVRIGAGCRIRRPCSSQTRFLTVAARSCGATIVFGVGGPNAYIFYTGEGASDVIPTGKPIVDNIPPGRAVVILADGQVIVTKFDVGELDLSRLQELLPLFEDFPDRFQDLGDQRAALGLPVCIDTDSSEPDSDDPDCD